MYENVKRGLMKDMRAQEGPQGAFGVRCDNGPWLRNKLHEETEEDA